ncbi:hypothetical protein ACLOJK_016031 [Asimina triloba]
MATRHPAAADAGDYETHHNSHNTSIVMRPLAKQAICTDHALLSRNSARQTSDSKVTTTQWIKMKSTGCSGQEKNSRHYAAPNRSSLAEE